MLSLQRCIPAIISNSGGMYMLGMLFRSTKGRVRRNCSALGYFRRLHQAKTEPLPYSNNMANCLLLEDMRKRTQERVQDDQQGFSQMVSGIQHIGDGFLMMASASNEILSSQKTKQLLIDDTATKHLKATLAKEVEMSFLLAKSNLLITRNIEWSNLAFGFWPKSRYVIKDKSCPESPLGFIHDESNVIGRQLLRNRRPLVASIIDASGNELFKIQRPFWWINSSVHVYMDGEEIGVVRSRWHLWKRIYNLYVGNKQFAAVKNPGFWNWRYTLKDIDGKVLAQIHRKMRGFGYEFFTDASRYSIRFGNGKFTSKSRLSAEVKKFKVARPLTIQERAVTIALAISLDSEHFSTDGGGWMSFFI